MAGIPWGKYERSDWRRVPGAQRRYRNIQHPELEISRRQFDEHYGAARPYGTYEKKAKQKSTEREATLRPARGRTSALKLPEGKKEAEINRRKISAKEAAALKRVERERNKVHKYPRTIDLRTFKKGKVSRTIELPVSWEAVEQVRGAAAKSGLVFGYYMGARMVTPGGDIVTPSAFGMRDIHMHYTENDFKKFMNKLLNASNSSNSAHLISLWIHLKLKSQVAMNRNGWKKRK